ncbi:MAG: class I SAM-dependent methyltransferase [Bryobacterales bacterium]|nr:class I SAM-dependent methyltransferase [Bryobacterales bacterium]
MRSDSEHVADTAPLEAVRRFWEENPLFSGVSRFAPGTREFFLDHQELALREHSGGLDSIFVKDIRPGTGVLDVGCGIGFWVHQFCMRGADVAACDLTSRAVELTRERVRMFNLQAVISEGNAEALPYEAGRFDHVNCQGVIHHTPGTAACIAEFHRVLRPGGTLCFSVYYRLLALRSRSLFRLVAALARGWVVLPGRGRENMLRAADPDELVRQYDGLDNPLGRAFTRAEVESMLAGRFQVLEVKRHGFPRYALPFSMPDSVHRLVSRWFGLMIVYRCRRI